MGRRLQQQERAGKATDQARDQQWNHDAHGYAQAFAVGSAAGDDPGPQGYAIRGVGRNRRHASEQQRREADEAAASSHGIERSAEHAGYEEKNSLPEGQA